MILSVLAAVLTAVALWRVRSLLPLGSINGRSFAVVPVIADPRIGRSRGWPLVMRFRVDDAAAGFPGGIGRIAHRALFSGSPGFTLNVVFASARPSLFGRSDYANPRSIWYNVFFGYYQVDVSREAWGRPFAYDLHAEGGPAIRVEELARLLKADWNHLSNQLYGVPEDAIRPLDRVDPRGLESDHGGRVRKEGWDGAWDALEIRELEVVGPYSAAEGRDYVDLGPVTGLLWRLCFGTHPRCAGDARSFHPTRLRMRAYLCFAAGEDERGEAVYRTFVFGAVINKDYDRVDPEENARFMDLQMEEIERLIGEQRGIGFRSSAHR